MDDGVFAPGTPEVEIDRQDGLKWDPTIRPLVVERHNLAVADAAPDGRRSKPR